MPISHHSTSIVASFPVSPLQYSDVITGAERLGINKAIAVHHIHSYNYYM